MCWQNVLSDVYVPPGNTSDRGLGISDTVVCLKSGSALIGQCSQDAINYKVWEVLLKSSSWVVALTPRELSIQGFVFANGWAILTKGSMPCRNTTLH